MYVRELRPGAARRLRQGRWPEELTRYEAEQTGPCPWRAASLESLLDRFAQLRDGRSGHGLRHRQRFILACAALSTLMTVDPGASQRVGDVIRGHWSAIENGTHYRRDVTLGEDACRTTHRQAAAVLASLRNLANGAYELERARERTKADTFSTWLREQTFGSAWTLLKR